MHIEDYMKKFNIKPRFFVSRLGISYTHLYKIMRKESVPSFELAFRLRILTDGCVTLNDLRPDLCKEFYISEESEVDDVIIIRAKKYL